MTEDKTEKYIVIFDVMMPGATRKTQYPITVDAASRVEALALAEDEWNTITGNYDTRITKSVVAPKEGTKHE
jgi:hypothetical protein